MVKNKEYIMATDSQFWNTVSSDTLKRINNESHCGAESRKLSERELQLRKQKYKLGKDYGDTYFSRREAECMVLFLDGKKNSEVAKELDLSVKTIECYTEKMKQRLGITSKIKLLDKVRESDFPKFKDRIIQVIRASQ